MMEPIEISDTEDVVIEVLTDSETELDFTSTQKINNDTSYHAIQIDDIQEIPSDSIDVINISEVHGNSMVEPPSATTATKGSAKKFSALDRILVDDSSSQDDDLVIEPSEIIPTKRNDLFVPDSSFDKTDSPMSKQQSTPSLNKSKSDLGPVSSTRKKSKNVRRLIGSSQPKPRSLTTIMPLIGSVTRKTSSSRKASDTRNFLDSDNSDDERHTYNPITSLKHKERLFLSSTPERIDASSSIGEIKQSTHVSKPIYPLNKIMKNDVEFSDSNDEEQPVTEVLDSSPKVEVSNPFLDKLMKHANKNKKRMERINQQLASRTKSARGLSSDTIQPLSPTLASKTYSEAELTRGVPTNDLNVQRPAQRNKTTGSINPRKSKEERELAKQQHLREKQARQLYQDVNKVNRKKDDLLNEMIINLSNPVIRNLDRLEYKSELSPIEINEVTASENMVTWSRKSNSVYEQESDSFKPSEPHLINEKICVFVHKAQEFLDMMEMETMNIKFSEIRTKNKSKFNNFIILINGYDQLIQKLRTQENRSYAAKVRSQMDDDDELENPGRKRKRKATKTISSYTADEIEAEIANLQVHGFKIFPTKNTHETIQWLRSFTYTISSARYDKVERNPDLANIGTIKSGINTHDTYLKMLLQFKFMTEVKANRVIGRLPTLSHLYNAVTNNRIPPGPDGKSLMASNIQAAILTLFSTRNDGQILES